MLVGPASFLPVSTSKTLIYAGGILNGVSGGLNIVSTFARSNLAVIRLGYDEEDINTYLVVSGKRKCDPPFFTLLFAFFCRPVGCLIFPGHLSRPHHLRLAGSVLGLQDNLLDIRLLVPHLCLPGRSGNFLHAAPQIQMLI